MFRSASLSIGTSFTVAVFTIFATSNVDSIVGIPHNIFNAKNFSPHKKLISLLNVPICTQGMQRTWWPEARTISHWTLFTALNHSHIIWGSVVFVGHWVSVRAIHDLLPPNFHRYSKGDLDDIVHWRDGWPGTGDVWVEHLMAGLGWWMIQRYVARNTEHIQTSEHLPDKLLKWVPIYIDASYIRDLTVCDLAIV